MNIALSVNDRVADRFMWLLEHFKDDVQVLDKEFLRNKQELHKDLADIDSGKVKMIDEDTFWKSTDEAINS